MKKKLIAVPVLLVGLWILMITFTACNDDDDNPTSSKGTVFLHLHTLAGTDEVEQYGDTLLLDNGRKISVSTAQLYLSNFRFIKTDGSEVAGPSTIIHLKQGEEEYELGEVTAGNYKSIRFDVGLSDAMNASNPGVSDTILYDPTMWFGSTAQPDGFVFINFQGAIDTTLNANGSELVPFAYKIGTNANRVTVTMPDQNHSIVPDQEDIYHIEVNYAHLLEGILLSNPNNLQLTTAAQNNSALAGQLVDNIPEMFEYE